MSAAHLLPVYGCRPLTISRGEGCYVFDAEGRRYLDFITGIGVNALGYAHPVLTRELAGQSVLCLHTSNLHGHAYQAPLASKLANWAGLHQVFFSNSGTEAVEAALKAARARANARGRTQHRILALENGFHGRTTGALSVTASKKYRDPFSPLASDVVFLPVNDLEALAAAATPETIAIIAEPVQGEGGIRPLSPQFLAAIAQHAAACDALWIADETQCGLGRTGHKFAFQGIHPEAQPDIVVTAKPLGGGLPLGATIFSARAAEALGEGLHGTTFGGGPAACRLALAFLNETERLLSRITRMGESLRQSLNKLHSPHIRDIRCHGLMAGIELDTPAAPIVARALDGGLVINSVQGNVIRLLPPYIVDEQHIAEACRILHECFAA